MTGEVMRPGFAGELLARLERRRLRSARIRSLLKAAGGTALTACVAALVAARGRRR